ncbi:PadR family transcriptional regulator [Asanoa iriomotensis]|uniref:PadR family transcriptional regulator n=1 Tax=Asanoa iriomotensis TaxID=234613 RepID=A0ABQ4C0W2_9ACTN|nr:PadR family transcriptional regulator [Asanoa iriomotensis]GIF56423.1 PadR family transcriptional regulator [Asanoa iriomotensis]
MPPSKLTNPLALAVLACLAERPMHPYEMATTLRERGTDESIKLNYGSLYTVVDTLQQRELIDAQEVSREGRRPERTVYRITVAGRQKLVEWLTELLSKPAKEFTQFEAGLSLMPVIPPSDVVVLLRARCQQLEQEIVRLEEGCRLARERSRARLFAIEGEYRIALRRAELEFSAGLADDIESGALEGTEWWTRVHELLATAPANSAVSDVMPLPYGAAQAEVG